MSERGDYAVEFSSRGRILVGAIGVIAFVTVAFLAIEGRHFLRRPVTAAQLEEEIGRDPEIREPYRLLRLYYPHDANAFYERAAAAANAGGLEAAKRAAFHSMQQFMRSKAGEITRGPTVTLQAIAAQYSALMHVLRDSDAQLCAQFAMTGFNPGQEPPHRAIEHLNRIMALEIQAAHDGEVRTAAPRATLGDTDRRSWIAGISAIDPSAAQLLADERALNAAPPVRQCAVGVALYDAAAALPAESAANVTAYLIRAALEGAR